jgi:tripartite-type tricarboxylate transporter receptor subunit TctC
MIPRILASLLAAASLGAHAQSTNADYPAKPLRVITGFPPGGPTDIVARAFADHAGRAIKQTLVVENKPGANTILAASAVATSAPDGYTLLVTAVNHTMTPALYGDRIRYNTLDSFAPVCTLAVSQAVLVVGPSMKVDDLAGFLAALRAKPGVHTYATPGVGSSGHFAAELFASKTGVQMTHIPYKGAAPAISDLMGGQVDMSFATLASVLPQIRAGKLKALAVAAPTRSSFLPDVPTFEESGVHGYAADAWYGVLAPAGTSPAILETLRQQAQAYVKDPQTKERLATMGLEPEAICGKAFGAQMKTEVETYTALARKLDLHMD